MLALKSILIQMISSKMCYIYLNIYFRFLEDWLSLYYVPCKQQQIDVSKNLTKREVE